MIAYNDINPMTTSNTSADTYESADVVLSTASSDDALTCLATRVPANVKEKIRLRSLIKGISQGDYIASLVLADTELSIKA